MLFATLSLDLVDIDAAKSDTWWDLRRDWTLPVVEDDDEAERAMI